MNSYEYRRIDVIPSYFTILCIVICILVLFISICFILHERRQTRKTITSIYAMLEQAKRGEFCMEHYDESVLSALETQFVQYLQASSVSEQNLAEEKEKIKELIGDISHQTKTPIANILLYSELLHEKELLLEDKKKEEIKPLINALMEQADKLNFLIQALVKMSRLETGVLSVNPSLQRVSPMLKKVCAQLEPKAEQKQMKLHLEETMETAYFDEKWTTEAIANIVDNAVKYSNPESEIQIRVIPYSMFCRIDIIDQGIGIKETDHAKIFQRFYRSSDVSNLEGVGVGLYLAREIITKEEGYIKVASTYGEGTTFSVFLSKETKE